MYVLVIMQFWVQFAINLYKWVSQKAEIAQATSVSAISAFLKNSQMLHVINFRLNEKNGMISY